MRPRSPSKPPLRDAYSLIEVLVAAGVLALGIAAAASMAGAITSQAEANLVIGRVLNLQEQAARLYQLGLEPDAIRPDAVNALLPPDPALLPMTYFANTTVTSIGSFQSIRWTNTFKPNPLTSEQRTNVVIAIRPEIH
jgi:type II secretory pathway pseudopilin PulG